MQCSVPQTVTRNTFVAEAFQTFFGGLNIQFLAMLAIDEETTIGDSDNEIAMAGAPIEPPKWLNQQFVAQYLQNHFNKNRLNIIQFKVKPATAKGTNYASYIYRVNVEYSDVEKHLVPVTRKRSETKRLNIVVKLALQGDIAFDVLSACNAYEKEIEFYEEVAPRIRQTLKQFNVSEKLLAETFGVSQTNSAILLEDLTTKGYQLAPLKPGFGMADAKMVLSKAATFHATCAVIEEKQPNFFANFNSGLISHSGKGGLDVVFLTQLDALIELVSSWPDFDKYTEKLRRFHGKFVEKERQIFDADPKQFNTLVHGDMWTNNMMCQIREAAEIKTNGASLENVIFLDFQFSCWASPAIDLQYFMNTSLCETLRTSHFDDLIEYYHSNLVAMLKRFNYGKHVPTVSELQSQFHEKSAYGFLSSCLLQPVMLNDHTENADFEALVLGDDRSKQFKRLIYQGNPHIQANMRKLIPFYDRLGVFD